MNAVAIQGGPASYSEQAARALLGAGIRIHHHQAIEGALERFMREAHTGLLLPWWNRSIGPIPDVHALIENSGLHHITEIELPIQHCLIGRAGCSVHLGGTVYSHPAALAQCRRFLEHNPQLEPCPSHDTADSIQRIRHGGKESHFAIAAAAAAKNYRMPVLQANIQDLPDNSTLFRLYGRKNT